MAVDTAEVVAATGAAAAAAGMAEAVVVAKGNPTRCEVFKDSRPKLSRA